MGIVSSVMKTKLKSNPILPIPTQGLVSNKRKKIQLACIKHLAHKRALIGYLSDIPNCLGLHYIYLNILEPACASWTAITGVCSPVHTAFVSVP